MGNLYHHLCHNSSPVTSRTGPKMTIGGVTTKSSVTDGSLKANLKYLDYEKAILPPRDPLDTIQATLDYVASAYLVQYNVDQELQQWKIIG